jgi:predicted phage terminase large subunit-like protein
MTLTPEVIEGFVKSVLIKHFDDPSPIPDFHKELWELCCSDHPLVAIAAPRGHAKSTAISFVYTLAAVLFRQARFVLLVSDTEGQAQLFLDQIKVALQTNTDLIQLFGVKSFDQDSKTDIIVRMEDGHRFRIMAKGSEQRVRGLIWDHIRPDLIIGDDLENDEIVMNDERRAKFRLWMIKALLPCRAPHGKVRIVGTILHLDSFLARMTPLEGERETVEEGPLKYISCNPRRMFKGILYKAHIGGHPSDIRKQSDLLWPERRVDGKQITPQWFMDKYQACAEIGHPEGYAQEYLNRPLDESMAFFRKSDLVTMTPEDHDQIATQRKPLVFYAGGDLAITENEKADYTAFVVVGIDSDGMMYVMEVVRERMDAKGIIKNIMQLQRRYKLLWFALEQDKTGKTILPFLKEEMMKSGDTFVNIVPIIPHTDKTARASSMQGRMRIGGVKFNKRAEWYPHLESELLTFPRGRHDDQVDAMSCIGLALQKLARANTLAEENEEIIKHEEELALSDADGRSATTGY